MKKFSFLIVLIVLPILSDACSCWTTPMSTEKINQYDLVFKGKAISKRMVSLKEDKSHINASLKDLYPDVQKYFEYTFEIRQLIKPYRHNSTVKIYTNTQGSACGSNFILGEQYYVFSSRNKGRYATNICNGNVRARKVSNVYKSILKEHLRGGENKEYYDENGSKIAKGSIRCSAPIGEWNIFHKDGSIASKGFYLKGKRHGEWLNYHNIKSSGELYEKLDSKNKSSLTNKENILKEKISYDNGNIISRFTIPYK